MSTFVLPDRRAPAFPDEPFSAYCRLCWQAVYCLYIDKDHPHGGKCMDGHLRREDCDEARRRDRNQAMIAKAVRDAASGNRSDQDV